jgi:HK97 family phage major capsid protein
MENNLTPEQVVEKLNGMFTEAVEKAASKDDFNNLKSEIESLKSLEVKSNDIEKAIARMEGKMEAAAESARFITPKSAGSIGTQVVKGIEANLDGLKGGKTIALDVKDTTIANNYTGTRALTELDTELDLIARPKLLVQNLISRGTTTSKFVTYIQQVVRGASEFVGEGQPKPETSLEYQEVTKEVKKNAAYIKVSKEMLSDLAFVRGEINTELMSAIEEATEDYIINDATDGIIAAAPSFVAGPFAAAVTTANLADVLRVAIAQIQAANYLPTHIVLHPYDAAQIHLSKTTQGEYTYGAFLVNPLTGEPQLLNLSVVVSNFMAQGTFLVGEMPRDTFKVRESINMSVGYVNDDFARNMVTILAESRFVNYVKNNQKFAFVKGNIATAIAAINN